MQVYVNENGREKSLPMKLSSELNCCSTAGQVTYRVVQVTQNEDGQAQVLPSAFPHGTAVAQVRGHRMPLQILCTLIGQCCDGSYYIYPSWSHPIQLGRWGGFSWGVQCCWFVVGCDSEPVQQRRKSHHGVRHPWGQIYLRPVSHCVGDGWHHCYHWGSRSYHGPGHSGHWPGRWVCWQLGNAACYGTKETCNCLCTLEASKQEHCREKRAVRHWQIQGCLILCIGVGVQIVGFNPYWSS